MKIVFYVDVTYGSTDLLHGDKSFNDLLRPYQLITKKLEAKGISVRAATEIPKKAQATERGIFFSFRSHKLHRKYLSRRDIKLGSFYILEPPVVRPDRYAQLPKLTKEFERVYLPNVHGDGYSLKGVDVSRLSRVIFPQAYDEVLEDEWNNLKNDEIVLINSNKLPTSKINELYSERIRALIEINKYRNVDLYGKGWKSWRKKGSFLPVFLRNRKKVLSSYHGELGSKYETLSKYRYSICFENMIMPGYLTEKIFDAFYVGNIPIYLGDPDISLTIPKECFIDMRDFSSYSELNDFLNQIDNRQADEYKASILQYMKSKSFIDNCSSSAFAENVVAEVIKYSEQL